MEDLSIDSNDSFSNTFHRTLHFMYKSFMYEYILVLAELNNINSIFRSNGQLFNSLSLKMPYTVTQ
jgi:hypothetical protein